MNKKPLLKEVYEYIDQLAPFSLSEDWDNSGIQIGFEETKIGKILLALDPSEDTINYACTNGFSLIITHHPLFFKPIKSLNEKNWPGKVVIKAISNKISLISAHTNLDKVKWGVSVSLAEKLGFPVNSPIIPEEEWGLGVMGKFDKPVKISAIIDKIKNKLKIETVRFNGKIDKTVEHYALCGGSCYSIAEFINKKSIPLFITSDVKYHEMGEAAENDLNIISIDHFFEKEVLPNLKNKLDLIIKENNLSVQTEIFENEQSYFKFI